MSEEPTGTEPKKPLVRVGIPSYGGLAHRTFFCWESLDKSAAEVELTYIPRMIIDRARNVVAKEALASSADYVLFVDDDMTFDADALTKMLDRSQQLIRKGEPNHVIGGLFFQRVPPTSQLIYRLIEEEGKNPSWVKIAPPEILAAEKDKALIDVDGIGTGFTLISRGALQAVRNTDKTRPFFRTICEWHEDGTETFLSEDLYFCARAKEAGCSVYCDTTIKVGHIGEHVYGFDDWKKYVDQQEAAAKARAAR